MTAEGDQNFQSLFDKKNAICLVFYHAVGDYLSKI
jgi:hypothetical protein